MQAAVFFGCRHVWKQLGSRTRAEDSDVACCRWSFCSIPCFIQSALLAIPGPVEQASSNVRVPLLLEISMNGPGGIVHTIHEAQARHFGTPSAQHTAASSF
jgi:hypothetical protein